MTVEQTSALSRATELHEQVEGHRKQARMLAAQRNTYLLVAYREGVGMAELAEALGVSVNAVSKALGRPSGRTWTRASPETTKAPSR